MKHRITPPYLLVIMFSGCLSQYLGSGPYFPRDGFEPNCKTNWWVNLLYINNIVGSEKMVRQLSEVNKKNLTKIFLT